MSSAAIQLGGLPGVHSAPASPGPEPVSTRSRLATKQSRLAARQDLERQLSGATALADDGSAISLLLQLSEIDLLLNDREAAETAADDALRRSRRRADKPTLADALVVRARAGRANDQGAVSVRQLKEARTVSEQAGYRTGSAQALVELIPTYFDLSRSADAIDSGEKAAVLCRELADRRCEARALYFLGAPYLSQGRNREARQVLQAAAKLWEDLAEPYDRAETLLELNFLELRQSQWRNALALLRDVNALLQDRSAEPFLVAQMSIGFGEVYEGTGELEIASRYIQQGLELYRDQAQAKTGRSDALRLAGRIDARRGDPEKARQEIEQALGLAVEIQSRQLQALCLEELGRVYLSAGNNAAALEQLKRASSLYFELGRRREAARALAFRGLALSASQDPAAAEQEYSRALRVFHEVNDLANEAAISFVLGKVKLDQGKVDQAGVHLQRSIDLTEQLRENASSQDLRVSFLASVHDRYEAFVAWLMAQEARTPDRGFAEQAFEANEAGRARSLLDAISGYQRQIRGSADPSLLIEEERLQQKERKLLDRQASIRTGAAPAADKAEVEAELDQVKAELDALQAKMSEGAGAVPDLLQAAPVKTEEIQGRITDAGTSVFEYSLGDRNSYLWVLSTEGLHTYLLPPRAEIEALARQVITGINHHPPDRGPQPELDAAIDRLSQMLLGPARDRLPRARLIVVADGILQYVPFAALTVAPNQPLMLGHEVINTPSAAILARLRADQATRPPHRKLLAAFGDPVMLSDEQSANAELPDLERGVGDDPSRNARGLGELIYAGEELNEIQRLAGMESTVYSRYDATRKRFLETDLSQYQVIHLATHGVFDARDPEQSGLIMSMQDRSGGRLNGFVGLADIYQLKVPADLVVLSACYTALGEEVKGEGLMGVTRGFMYAGTPTVVASLWRVDDEASAELMKRFYYHLLVEGMTPSAALAAAQNSIRKERNWSAPFYWAAFTVQGDFGRPIKPRTETSHSWRVWVALGGAALILLTVGAWIARRRRGESSRNAA